VGDQLFVQLPGTMAVVPSGISAIRPLTLATMFNAQYTMLGDLLLCQLRPGRMAVVQQLILFAAQWRFLLAVHMLCCWALSTYITSCTAGNAVVDGVVASNFGAAAHLQVTETFAVKHAAGAKLWLAYRAAPWLLLLLLTPLHTGISAMGRQVLHPSTASCSTVQSLL
jgi:hypothetical protein